MKNYILPSTLAAVLILFSCTREPVITSEESTGETRSIAFHATQSDTKTVFGPINSDKTYPVLWQTGDEVAISHNWSESFTTTHYSAKISNDGKDASFIGDFTLADDTNTFIVVSPFASAKSQSKNNNRILVEWPSSQTPILADGENPSSPDPAAQVLFGRMDYDSKADVPSSIEMSFNHLSAYLRMRFTNVNLATSSGEATVLSVSLATEDTPLAGRFQYYFDDSKDYKNFENNAEAMTVVTASVNTFSNGDDIWIGIRPVALSGKKLTFKISTDKGTLTKEVSLTEDDKYNLSSGSVATFTVNMDGISLAEPVTFTKVTDPSTLNWGDEIIIAAADYDIALSTTQNTNNRSGAGVTKAENGDKILDPSSSVDIITLEDGVIPGQFSFHTPTGYLYARNDGTINSTSNILQTIADKTGKENHASWAITNDNGTTRIKANLAEGGSDATAVRPHLRYNQGNNLFTAYNTQISQNAIAVYARTPENIENHFAATMPDANSENAVSSSYAAKELDVYIFANVAWTASVTGEGASLSATSGTGNAILTLSIPENTSMTATPTYTVNISTTAVVSPASYTFTVNQNAKPLWGERWISDWTTAGDTPETYQSRANVSTSVYNNGSVTYKSAGGSGNTKLYKDYIIYISNFKAASWSGGDLPDNPWNLMIGKSNGWFTVTGIPCPGVKKATLTYLVNRSDKKYTATSTTSGVSFSSLQQASEPSDWVSQNSDGTMGTTHKNIYTITYEITFDQESTLNTFDIKFENTDGSNNIRVAEIQLVATEVF